MAREAHDDLGSRNIDAHAVAQLKPTEFVMLEGGARHVSRQSRLRLPLELAHRLASARTPDDVAVSTLECLVAAYPEAAVHFLPSSPSDVDPPVVTELPAAILDALWPAGMVTVEHDELLWFGVPMRCRDGLHGHLVIGFDSSASITDDDRDLLELVSAMAAGECSRLKIYQAFDRHVSDLTFIHDLDRRLSRADDMTAMFEVVTEQLRTVVRATMCGVMVADDERGILTVVATDDTLRGSRLGFEVPISASRAGSVYRSGKAVLVPDVLADATAYGKSEATWRSLMIVPLISGGRTFGTLHVGHSQPYVYDTRDLRMVELIAAQIANALCRALEQEREQELHLAAIEALSAAVDARDPFTHTHSRRVAHLAARVALRMGLPDADVEQIELAGLLHDVGKIGIPDRILTKPGRLDAEERLIMMSHSEMGARIIGGHPALSELVPIVRHHHEWHDGRGYPDGLRGDLIPLGAAIMSVADALETMTSNRVYRKAMSVVDARQELERGRGGQFRPEVIDAMLDLIDDDAQVRRLLDSSGHAVRGTAKLLPIQNSDVIALRVLSRIAKEIGALTEIDTFLDHVHAIVRDELDLHDVVIWLHDPEINGYTLAAGSAALPAPDAQRLVPSKLEAGPESGKITALVRENAAELAAPTVICPMYVEDSLIGLIELVHHSAGAFEARDIELLQAIAAPVAPTVRVAQLHDQVKHAAATDGLTGVLNHRAFYQRLELQMNSLGPDEEINLLIVDVIGLKAINDNYGHTAGDEALRSVAGALVSRLRDADIVARYGGDEFAAILRGPLEMPIESIVERIERPVRCRLDAATTLDLRLRCGWSSMGSQAGRATELVARADSLLYRNTSPTLRA
jgi:diguanylate cyclase (GGDEF)-like protein/putative nucleotidyltransferase with HDIG domain